MSLSPAIEKALNKQLNAELASAYLYLSMSASLALKNMPGCSHWMQVQAEEELTHAMKIKEYLLDRKGAVRLANQEAPPHHWSSVLETFNEAHAHEQQITCRVNELLELAIKEKDRATENLLRWFIDEQVEEEATLDTLIQKFKLIGDSGSGLYALDAELAARTAALARETPRV